MISEQSILKAKIVRAAFNEALRTGRCFYKVSCKDCLNFVLHGIPFYIPVDIKIPINIPAKISSFEEVDYSKFDKLFHTNLEEKVLDELTNPDIDKLWNSSIKDYNEEMPTEEEANKELRDAGIDPEEMSRRML